MLHYFNVRVNLHVPVRLKQTANRVKKQLLAAVFFATMLPLLI